ncbi:gliding motility-associated C-terminal domain-containing protein [Cytophaga aurantiaca]|uniref:T9SS type B sorting domain-containing protein n=1 Tax=Cytophaga aurantiaca TaxID=29530 RepID=UPI0003A7F042|nr:gliding motility-associated C-terminal domain-containing protein [Cytophaga aurantiaca]
MNKQFLRSFIFLVICFFIQTLSYATHIVGGEIVLERTGNGNRYRVILNKYINEISVRQHGISTSTVAYVDIYDKNTNILLTSPSMRLDLVTNDLLSNNGNYCSNLTIIETSKQVYMGEIDLGAAMFSPTGSYYITWSDCCRNQEIANLKAPKNENIALYTEFRGYAIQDDSPKFVPVGNDFFCRNNVNVFDLSAVDRDGDDLKYSLVAPRSSVNPSTDVVWDTTTNKNSGDNPIPGSMPFTIDPTTGIATFNPSANGVYVFGVKVEEFRNGQKIGEVRRDFQLNVQDCPVNNKPVIAFQNSGIKVRDTLSVKLKGGGCFPIYITDVDATHFISETIYINTRSNLPAGSTNTPYPTSGFTIPSQVPLTGFRDTTWFNACFDPCAGGLRLDETTYYPFKIVINDNRCPAKYDTLIFTIRIEVEKNTQPQIFIDPPGNPKTVKVDEQLKFNVYGTDADAGDLLSLKIANPQRGMSFMNVQDSSSTISSMFSWRPNCNDLHPGNYDVYFIIKDNSCTNNPRDTIHQRILVQQDDVSFDGMEVTNLITPNGDGMNDYYHIPGIPVGNCDKYFKGIEIYNRWGSRVFYSQDPGFKWYPNVSDGVYYFSIDLNYEVRKGWLQITQ